MDIPEFKKLIQQGEGIRCEFKEAQNGVPNSLYDTIASFLNREGGIIFLGITDDAKLLGLPIESTMRYKQDIVTALNNAKVLNPPFPLAVHEIMVSDKTILYIRVPISSFIHKHSNTVYDRENDSDFRITDDARISEMYARKRSVFTENQIFPNLNINDLDTTLFNKVRNRIAIQNANHPWIDASNERILRDARFLRRDYSTGEEGLTLAAALVFGTDDVIGNILPAYRIDVIERRVNLDRWDDRLLIKTNLIDSYLQILAFLKTKWPEKFYQDKSGNRKDLRELIFRELVANILIHREYNSAKSTEVIISKDQIIATNPNRVRFKGPLDLERFYAEPKNPNIRAFFNVLSWADEIGSGVKNMNHFVEIYSDGAHPIFIEDDVFKSIIPMLSFKVGEKYILYLQLSQLDSTKMSSKEVKMLKQISLNLTLKGYNDLDELSLQLVKYWNKKSGELHDFRLLVNKELEASQEKKVGSNTLNSGEFLKKRGRILISTLLLVLQPKKLEELARVLEYKSKERYRDDYIKPLKNNELISYTLEKANDPNQHYLITNKGISFLGGNL